MEFFSFISQNLLVSIANCEIWWVSRMPATRESSIFIAGSCTQAQSVLKDSQQSLQSISLLNIMYADHGKCNYLNA